MKSTVEQAQNHGELRRANAARVQIEDKTAAPIGYNLPNWAWRIRFSNGQWSGWHEGYHSSLDAERAALRA